MQNVTTVDELRRYLNLADGEMLVNGDGQTAEILAIMGDKVILGMASRMNPIEVPVSELMKARPGTVRKPGD